MTDRTRPLFLFTDFGRDGPYVGQMHAAVYSTAPRVRVVDLMHDAPAMRPGLACYLLPACCRALPDNAVVVAVVDPGVGGERAALLVETARQTFVGPDNGLLSRLEGIRSVRRIAWRPQRLSPSFHGRDLFAPAAARVAAGQGVESTPLAGPMVGADWAPDLAAIVYIDGYGNLMTGLAADRVDHGRTIRVGNTSIGYAETFCKVPEGQVFWYRNSQNLVEIAANGRSAARVLSLALGNEILLD